MDLYDSRYFSINKFLCTCLGIWPFESKNKYLLRILPIATMIIFLVPHVVALIVHRRNVDRLMEYLSISIFMLTVVLKLVTVIIAQDKMKRMLKDVVINWQSITDEKEKQILKMYSERGRYITIGYIAFIVICTILFVFLPLTPIAINKMRPSAEPLPHLFLMNTELYIDKDIHYWKIYFWDLINTCTNAWIVIVVDTLFAACVEQCVGLFAILRYRLQTPNALTYEKSTDTINGDASYKRMKEIVKLHQVSLRFAITLETAYSLCFFVIMIASLVVIPMVCVLIIVNSDETVQLIRWFVIFIGLSVHLFYLCLAGQKVIDDSANLFSDAYYNEWYKGSKKTKILLRFFILRCTQPAMLTAGGLVIMGMETYLKIMKTSVSYITVLSSFR